MKKGERKLFCVHGHDIAIVGRVKAGQCKECKRLDGKSRYISRPRQHMNLVGQKFGKLEVISFSYRDKRGQMYWNCLCHCGVNKVIRGSHLTFGKIVSCGCKHKLPKGVAIFRLLYRSYKRSAVRRKHAFTFTEEEFREIVSKNCFYCNVEPLQKASNWDKHMTRGEFYFNGIDRLNNDLGYTVGNCVPCCKICNFLKKELSYAEFLLAIKRIYEYKINNLARTQI